MAHVKCDKFADDFSGNHLTCSSQLQAHLYYAGYIESSFDIQNYKTDNGSIFERFPALNIEEISSLITKDLYIR